MSSISTKIYSKCDLSICDYDLDPTYSLSNDAISDCMDYQSKCNFVLKDKLKYTINNNTTDVDKYYNNKSYSDSIDNDSKGLLYETTFMYNKMLLNIFSYFIGVFIIIFILFKKYQSSKKTPDVIEK